MDCRGWNKDVGIAYWWLPCIYLDCVGLGVLDQKRIDFLQNFDNQKNKRHHTSIKSGLLAYPPLIPDTAPFSKSKSCIVSIYITIAYPTPYVQPMNPDTMHSHVNTTCAPFSDF